MASHRISSLPDPAASPLFEAAPLSSSLHRAHPSLIWYSHAAVLSPSQGSGEEEQLVTMEGAKARTRHRGRCSLHHRGSPASSSAPSSACLSHASSPSAREKPPLEMLMQERLDGGSGEGIQSQDPLCLGLHHRRWQERREAMSCQCLVARWVRPCPTASARSGC